MVASIYLLKSITWIPIQILYIHSLFEDYVQYEATRINDKTLILSLDRLCLI